MVHQRFSLIDGFTVAENIVLLREPRSGLLFYDRERARRAVRELAVRYGMEVDPDAPVASLSVGQKQRVEILRILHRGSRVLVLDEPTSLLTEQEVHSFFAVLRQLKELGHTIIIITHKLDEVGRIADRVTVMRGGEVVGTRRTAEVDKSTLARLMVGKEVLLQVQKPPFAPGRRLLRVRGLTLHSRAARRPLLKGVRLDIHAGEIFGVAGVAGNGLAELEDALTGMTPSGQLQGQVSLDGQDVLGASPARLRRLGLAYVPADRLHRGSSLSMKLSDNLIVKDHHNFLWNGILQRRTIADFSRDLIRRFDIKGHMSAPIRMLSGGNIQRAVLSRELSGKPGLLVISEPTWGLDILSSEFVYRQIVAMREAGTAILLISSNLDEILALSDTIAVLYKGEVAGCFRNEGLDREFLGGYMLGLKRQAAAAAAAGPDL
jgi:simple sugar transport system ATP-binding protein